MTQDFAVYVHWPFCLSKCPYCDFNSHVSAGIDHGAWRAALLSELKHYAALTPGRTVSSVFFGGGTPSLMEPETVAAVLDAIAGHWAVSDDVEITLEANPTSVEVDRLAGFKAAGVNRVSLGIQSLRDESLAILGRQHDVAGAVRALKTAASLFDRFTFDLIYARPNQSMADWQTELNEALVLAGGHVSLYQLTVEPGTAFFRDGIDEIDPDLAADLYDLTQDMCEDAGLPAYEVSNHARPGEESRHNLTYWLGGDYVGIGPGAHGRLTLDGQTKAIHQITKPERWLSQVQAHGHATGKSIPLEADDRFEEQVMTALRLTRPIAESIVQSLDSQKIQLLIETGDLIKTSDLRVTRQGRLRLNSVLQTLLG